jgi:hypothetical protein
MRWQEIVVLMDLRWLRRFVCAPADAEHKAYSARYGVDAMAAAAASLPVCRNSRCWPMTGAPKWRTDWRWQTILEAVPDVARCCAHRTYDIRRHGPRLLALVFLLIQPSPLPEAR